MMTYFDFFNINMPFKEFKKQIQAEILAGYIKEMMGGTVIEISKIDIDNFYDSVKKQCHNCLKIVKKTKRCSECHSSYYCSKECQKADYSNHKSTCSEIKNCISLANNDNDKKQFYIKHNACYMFINYVLKESIILSNKDKKKKFWKFITNSINGDYYFAPLSNEENNIIYDNVYKESLNQSNFRGVCFDMEIPQIIYRF